ncbi:FtsX-like permease family protein [Pedobacter sp. HMF7647]|uniref:FtsX-like permease family protein n=1 Tax=Hufsiella arboris TaxID=2695275 RepID=A0A7K1YAU3_9SPHI|nr:FtsX-like permease family protein [Hufsiella arboris]MXV51471.1 FtsX-like permease family protein [Hufsiella arboris]
MLRNYLLLAFRNIRKNKLHAIINVGGMAVAFTCSIFIFLLVYRHFSYDEFQKNGNQLFKVYSYSIGPNGEEKGTSMAFPFVEAVKKENIGIVKATSIHNRGKLVRYKEKTLDMTVTMVDNDFFDMFTFPLIKGNNVNPLSDLNSVVIAEKFAHNLFGEEDPLGKSIDVKLGGKWYSLTVSAVAAEPPKNSSIRFSVLARTEIDPDYPLQKNNWNNRSLPVFVELAQTTTDQKVESRLRAFTNKYTPTDKASYKKDGYKADKNGDYHSFRLLPLSELHFSPQLGGGGTISKPFLYILILISAVILLIASFNFVNLNIGLSFTRTKEIGVRKCLGAAKKQIWLQVWGESFLLVIIATLLAMTAVYLAIRSFNNITDGAIDSNLLFSPTIVGTVLLLTVLVSVIASGYPSAVMAKLKTTEVLKGKISANRSGGLRNALIVTQFTIAVILIGSTIIIYRQFDHLRTAPLGYNTTSIISIPIKNEENGKEIINKLRGRLASQSSVISVSGSNTNLGIGQDKTQSTSVMCFDLGDKKICGQVITGDFDMLKTLGIKPVEGHDFLLSSASDTSNSVILSESYAKQFGRKSMADFSYATDTAQAKVRVAGVIPDFHFTSVNDTPQPLVIYRNNETTMNYAWIRVNTSNPSATMNMVKSVYASVEPGVEFNGSYVNENIERLYEDEQTMARLFSVAAGIAIVLSCMGLFGIASITIRQRVKEIGVRKVLGASVSAIVTLVSREFIKPVLIAFLIAIPIDWWMMNKWLQDYSYRTDINWWIFGLAAVVSVAIALITVSFHAIKAAIANPVESLRTE